MNMNGISNKFLGRMFRKVDSLVWDLTTGTIGIKDQHGIHTLTSTPGTVKSGKEEVPCIDHGISVNPFDQMGFAIPAFATPTPLDKVDIEDMVVGDTGILGWVIEKKPASLVLLDKAGMRKQYTPPKQAVIGIEGPSVVKSLGGLFGGDAGKLGGMQGALMPLLMFGGMGDGGELDDILPLMLFTQTQGQGTDALKSMMPLLIAKMMGKNIGGGTGGTGFDMKDFMMMQMLGGGGVGGLMENPMMMAMLLSKDDSPVSFNGVPALQAIPKRGAGRY